MLQLLGVSLGVNLVGWVAASYLKTEKFYDLVSVIMMTSYFQAKAVVVLCLLQCPERSTILHIFLTDILPVWIWHLSHSLPAFTQQELW